MSEISISRETVADLGRTNLFFLCKEILRYDKMVKRVHEPVCEHFVHKTPGLPFQKQDKIKNRILLDPRGHYKTSIDIGDCVQWMLVDPNIQIILFSGSKDRTAEMIGEMKHHFIDNNYFREIYPNFVPRDGISTWDKVSGFTIPARTMARRSPTIQIATLGSVKAALHGDVRKGDDVVNEINSRTKEGCAQTIKDWGHTAPLVNPGGYTELLGTCYDYSDLYNQQIEKMSKHWKIFKRACWTINRETGKREVLFPEQFCTNENPDPEKANLDEILEDMGPILFAAQYLNDPIASESPKFPIALLEQQTISRRAMPSDMTMFLTLDLGFTDKEESDYTFGIFGGYGRDGSQFVFDGFRGQMNASAIVNAIISGSQKWSINRIGIEDAAGTRLLAPGLYAKMKELGIYLQIDWIPVSRQRGRKRLQVEGLEALLTNKKLWFAKEMSILPQLYTEFTRYPKYRYDDGPDAIALLEYYRNMAPANRFLDMPGQIVELGGATAHTMFYDMNDGPSPEGDYEGLSAGLVG